MACGRCVHECLHCTVSYCIVLYLFIRLAVAFITISLRVVVIAPRYCTNHSTLILTHSCCIDTDSSPTICNKMVRHTSDTATATRVMQVWINQTTRYNWNDEILTLYTVYTHVQLGVHDRDDTGVTITVNHITPHHGLSHALPGSRPSQRSSRGNVVGGLVRHHAGSTKEGQPDAGHHHHLCLLGTRQRHMLGNSRFTSVQKRSSSRVSRTESLGEHCWLVWNSFEIIDDYLNYTWFDCITSALKLTCEKGNVNILWKCRPIAIKQWRYKYNT